MLFSISCIQNIKFFTFFWYLKILLPDIKRWNFSYQDKDVSKEYVWRGLHQQFSSTAWQTDGRWKKLFLRSSLFRWCHKKGFDLCFNKEIKFLFITNYWQQDKKNLDIKRIISWYNFIILIQIINWTQWLTRHMYVKHGCPRRQQNQNMAKISKSYILTPPHPRGLWCQWSGRNP